MFKHDPVSVMAVGTSGAGKSTIGNALLGEKKAFKTSRGAKSCTQDAKISASADGLVTYTDVPGIPDTNPKHTKAFYDIVVKHAKMKQTVIMFVFSCGGGRRLGDAEKAIYRQSALLFKEINKSRAAKILILNDFNRQPDWEELSDDEAEREKKEMESDHKNYETEIKDLTGIDFMVTKTINEDNRIEELQSLKILVNKLGAHKSPDLMTFEELEEYVKDLSGKNSYEKTAYDEQHKRINDLQSQLTALQATLAAAATAATAATVAAFFTFGATLGIATPTASVAAAAAVAIELKKRELQTAKNGISDEALSKATAALKKQCDRMEELGKVLKGEFKEEKLCPSSGDKRCGICHGHE